MKTKRLWLVCLVVIGIIGLAFGGLALAKTDHQPSPPRPYRSGEFFFPPYLSDNERMGFRKTSDHDTTVLNAGWALGNDAEADLTNLGDVEYIRTIYLATALDFCQAATQTHQVTPSLTGTTLIQAVQDQPGVLWMIGHEPDSLYNGDPIQAELYAELYHYFVTTIKTTDPTAKVAVAEIVQPSPLRMAYLDKILQHYQETYHQPLPTDVWTTQLHHMNEEACGSWGVGIPPFSDQSAGWQLDFEAATMLDVTVMATNLRAFRQWIYDRGYGDHPLLITEVGVLPPPSFAGFEDAVAAQFLTDMFDMLLTTTDPTIGYAADGGRLAQMWAWSSTNSSYGGDLFASGNSDLTIIGRAFVTQTTAHYTPYVDLQVTPPATTEATAPNTIFVDAYVNNRGNITATNVQAQVKLIDYFSQAILDMEIYHLGDLAGRANHPPAYIEKTWHVILPAAFTVTVTADPNQLLADLNPANNDLAQQIIWYPDLALTNLDVLSLPVGVGDDIMTALVTTTVTNRGNWTSTVTPLQLQVQAGNAPPSPLGEEITIPALGPNEAFIITTPWTTTAVGLYQIKAIINPNAVPGLDLNAGNNEAIKMLAIIRPNRAPNQPSNPTPADGAGDIPFAQPLSWQSSDPDGDPVTYTLAFGSSDPPPVVATAITTTTYDPGELSANTHYYWAISAGDGSKTTAGPTWSFTAAAGPTTGGDQEPNDTCPQAKFIPTDGTVQIHTFAQAGDEDWVAFQATAGITYVIEARVPPTSTADIVLELYDSCGGGGNFDDADQPFNPDIRLAFPAPANGTYYLRLFNHNTGRAGPEARYHLSVRAVQETLPSGAVILVAGRLRENDPLQANIHYVTNELYAFARSHGCTEEQIAYLAADTAMPGVTASATKAHLREAITQWAAEGNKVGPDRPLTLYLMDHGKYDRLYLDGYNEVITPLDLDGWLDELAQTIPGVAVNVVVEACYAGSFIDPQKSVSAPDRVVIASTTGGAVAYASQEGATFSDTFLKALGQGMNLYGAFEEGAWAARQGHPEQQPWLDGDGDGIANEPDDERIAVQRSLACLSIPPGANWPPHIAAIEVRNLSGSQGEIWARVEDDGQVKLVWAIIYPPSYQPPQAGEEMIAEPVAVPLFKQQAGWYASDYGRFTELGAYTLVVHAEDNEFLRSRPQTLIVQTGWEVYLPLVIK